MDHNLFKAITLACALGLLFSLSGCGGSGKSSTNYTPSPVTGEKVAKIYFALSGDDAVGRDWDCTYDLSVNPGNFQRKGAYYALGGEEFPNGSYKGAVDVSCGCVNPANAGCGFSSKFYLPKFEVYTLNGSVKKTLFAYSSQAINGFTTDFSFTVKEGVAQNAPTSSGTANNVPNSSGKADIEFVILDHFEKDSAGNPSQGLTCNLDYDQAWHGGFGFHNVKVKNTTNTTMPSWSANINFGTAKPKAQWSNGVSRVVNNGENTLTVHSDKSLAPGQEVSFGVGGTYTDGTNHIYVNCF